MTTVSRRTLAWLASACVLCCGIALYLVAPAIATDEPTAIKKGAVRTDDVGKRLTVAEARERAQLVHNIYAATLEVMHHRYFRRDRSVLPARAMEDVFAELDTVSGIKTKWIAVNTRAMSIDHEPKSEFEKSAANAIAAGKETVELVDHDFYHRAGSIPLGSGCISCHTGFLGKTPPTPRFAGLVISFPLKTK